MIHGLYVEVEPIIDKWVEKGIHFYYICGGRGIGKTYGALHLCHKIGTGEKKILGVTGKFMYLRLSKTEAESVAAPESCPFKRYNLDENINITADFSSKLGYGNFYIGDDDEKEHIGYCAGLSTFSNLRGIDFSDVMFILFDECIPENAGKIKLKNIARALLNMIESINRNRALLGEPELVLLMLSNPIDLTNDLLTGLHFSEIITSMMIKGQQKYTDYNRAVHIEVLKDHAVSKLKGQKSALYKFSKGTGFNDEALTGDFVNNDLTEIHDVPLSEYNCLYQLGNIYVYQHKTEQLWHICEYQQPAKITFRITERERIREIVYWQYKLLLAYSQVSYSTVTVQQLFNNIVGYTKSI